MPPGAVLGQLKLYPFAGIEVWGPGAGDCAADVCLAVGCAMEGCVTKGWGGCEGQGHDWFI